jgi:hypothetical protein
MCDLNAAPPRALLCSSEIYERVFPAGPNFRYLHKADIGLCTAHFCF